MSISIETVRQELEVIVETRTVTDAFGRNAHTSSDDVDEVMELLELAEEARPSEAKALLVMVQQLKNSVCDSRRKFWGYV